MVTHPGTNPAVHGWEFNSRAVDHKSDTLTITQVGIANNFKGVLLTTMCQVITSASSFDEDPSAVKVRRPKKGKKGAQGGGASVDEKEAMVTVSYSSAASHSLTYLVTCVIMSKCTRTPQTPW